MKGTSTDIVKYDDTKTKTNSKVKYYTCPDSCLDLDEEYDMCPEFDSDMFLELEYDMCPEFEYDMCPEFESDMFLELEYDMCPEFEYDMCPEVNINMLLKFVEKNKTNLNIQKEDKEDNKKRQRLINLKNGGRMGEYNRFLCLIKAHNPNFMITI